VGAGFDAGSAVRRSLVALGREPADVILTGGDLVNVYTGELLKDQQVLIAGERIAYVGPERDFPVGDQTEVVDVRGRVIIPGLIDGHFHMDVWLEPQEFVALTLPRGTTALITETSGVAASRGVDGLRRFLERFRGYPQRLYATAPMIAFLCAGRGEGRRSVEPAEMEEILTWPEIVGLGEIYWSRLLNGAPSPVVMELIAGAVRLGKTVEGHGAGARKRKLAAFAACGVDACHEAITAEEVRERLRLGMDAMIREGSIRRELETVIPPLLRMGLDLRRAMFVSDTVWPNDLVKYGHMDFILNRAIALGLDPIRAIQMGSLHVAEHFHLDGDLGGIAPGKCADLVVIPDPAHIEPELVFCRGRLVARNGKLTVELPAETEAGSGQELRLPRVDAGYFHVPAAPPEASVRVMKMVADIVNEEISLALPVINGQVTAAPDGDVLKVAVIDRFAPDSRRSIGFFQGFGLRRGALGSSFSFDGGNPVVIGADERDMAAVVNRIGELGGGIVFCRDGRVVEELPLAVGGVRAALSGRLVAEKIEALLAALKEAGCKSENPLLTLLTLTFTAIPALRLTARGCWLARENRYVDLFI